MIRKFINLKNVGKFVNFNAKGDITLKKVNLVYGENGRGKTTLCSILRSLKENNSLLIEERKTLGISGDCACKIQTAIGLCNFKEGAWDTICPHILVFDSDFVHRNIYMGDVVDHQHKKNLFQVIVGEEGIEYKRKIDEINEKIKENNSGTKLKAKDIEKYIPEGVLLNNFISIENDPNIGETITKTEKELKKVTRQIVETDLIKQKPLLSSISLPSIPDQLEQTLLASEKEIDESADEKVKSHLKDWMISPDEKWISEGVNLIKDENCPFCSQSISENHLVQAYRTFFNQGYRQLLADVSNLESLVKNSLNEETNLKFQKTISENNSSIEYWRNHLNDFNISEISSDEIIRHYQQLLQESLKLIKAKESRPLERVDLSPDFLELKGNTEKINNLVVQYNESVKINNERISSFKTSLPTKTDADNLDQKLKKYKVTKERFKPEVIAIVLEYQKMIEEKSALVSQKKEEKNKLDKYCEGKMSTYEKCINTYLAIFNTGFSITKTRHNYTGGAPNSQYNILINNVPVGLEKFKISMSSGDRNSLALAFFLASLDHDPDLGGKLVAFDDPFTSLDRFRRESTAQICKKISKKCKQIIVLSHDPYFLKLIYDKYPSGNIKTLQMPKFISGSTIVEWNIEEELKSSYMKNYSTLILFVHDGLGGTIDVARAIRPFIEGLLRAHFPGHFTEKEWLGDFIQKIRDSEGTSGLNHAKDDLEEIESINEYSKKFHHDQNPNADSELINSDELEGFAKRTLALVGGI